MNIQLKKQHTVIIVAGPTAVGKTTFAINLAQRLNTQIISADSRQCYKELSIGVAKPSKQQLLQVQHYFINSHSVHNVVNAGVYEQFALQAVEQIFATNKFAVVVGGTGLYINAFCNGIDAIPEIDTVVRNQILQQYNEYGLQWLQQEIKAKDELFWQTAEQQNPQRLLRALEVVVATGKSICDFKTKSKASRPFNIIKVALALPKEQLHKNINNRVDEMINEGLVNEVQQLIEYKNLNALQTVGYKELFNYFEGTTTLPQAIEQIKIHTRQYAKRQMTWFKKDTNTIWLDANNTDEEIENILKML